MVLGVLEKRDAEGASQGQSESRDIPDSKKVWRLFNLESSWDPCPAPSRALGRARLLKVKVTGAPEQDGHGLSALSSQTSRDQVDINLKYDRGSHQRNKDLPLLSGSLVNLPNTVGERSWNKV